MKLIVVEEFDTSGPSSVTFRKEYLFAFQFWYCDALIVCGLKMVGWGIKSHLSPAGILAEAILMNDIFWHFVSNGYFYVLFLWAIAVSDFCPLEIYKNLGLPVSTATFAVNNQADNHCYKYIYLFQILYSMKSVFF